MASRSGPNSKESSPSIIRPDDSEDDLEATFDLNSLTASQSSAEQPLNEGNIGSSEAVQEQDSIINRIKKEEVEIPWTFSKVEYIELSDSEQSPSLIPIKEEEEPMTWKFLGGECIDLMDLEQDPADISVKKETIDAPWKFTKSELVALSDTEDEIPHQNQLPVTSSIHEGMEDMDHENMNREDLNHENTKNADANNKDSEESVRSRIQYYQKMLAERALGRPLAEGADQLFNKLQTSHPQTSDNDALDANSWMNATIDPDADSGAAFAEAEKEYDEKLRAGRADLADVIKYRKATMTEEARLKRLAFDRPSPKEVVPSDDANGESDSDLFVAQEIASSRKRPHTMVAEDEGDVLEDEFESSAGNPLIKRAKPMSKRRQANHTESELEASMLAGIEHVLANSEKKEGQNQTTSEAPNRGKPNEKGSHASKGKTANGNSRRLKKTSKKGRTKKLTPAVNDCLNEIKKLLHINISEEANNNLGARELPTVVLGDKQKALTALIASVPLEERGSVRGQKSQILRCIKNLGPGMVHADRAGKWKLKGMTSSLYHHQLQGVSWMHERETGTVQPLGGLQADVMGFGKTVMMIAAILANPPGPNDSKCTLIVCAPAILTQWMDEIKNHVERRFLPRVIRYQATASMITFGRDCESEFSNANIILTTYQEVLRSYPRYSPPKNITTAEEKQSWWKTTYQTNRGMLHTMLFFRVILDEAQAIKNYNSHTSVACRALMAKHRWALSGTPIYNTIDELYPYFKFLRVKHTGNFDEFKRRFCDLDNADSLCRLHVFLKQMMIRRTHKDKLFGAPIVSMPRNTQKTDPIKFNLVEQAIYDAYQSRSIKTINKDSRAGMLEKSYRNMLHMLLRLRQLTDHPFMLPGFIEKLFTLQDVQNMEEKYAPNLSANERDMLSTMRKMIQAYSTPREVTEDITPKPVLSNSQGEEDDDDKYPPFIASFRKILRELANSSKWEEYNNRTLCHRCKDQPDDPWVTGCEHLYCNECLKSLDVEAEKEERRSACLECGQFIKSSYACGGIEELDLHKDITSTAAKASKPKKKQKGQNEDIKWINFEGKFLPSSKILAVQAQVEQWLQEDPSKKIILFGQFYSLLTILEWMCQQKDWDYCRYDGTKNHLARNKVIDDFRDKPEKLILIASLKCGGVGLNLTMASRVICIDLWWNNSVEQQAFCRVFRIGQNFETFVSRFVVEDSVEERMQKLQEDKAKKIGAAMDDPKMNAKLTVEELLQLFGAVVHEDQNPVIVIEGGPTSRHVPPGAITESEDSE